MEGYDLLLIVLFVCFVSSSATNLRAVYVADGSIKVTWDHPATTFERVSEFYLSVYESDQRLKLVKLSANEHVYRYIHSHTRPDTAYTFEVDTMISNYVDKDETTITTPSAIYGQRGTRLKLFLPRPSGGISYIVKNKGTLSTLDTIFGGYIFARIVAGTRKTVNVTPRDTELTITRLEPHDAGYYYIMQPTENKIIGGKMLVVTDTPTRPTITRTDCFSLPTTSLTLTCSSQSRSRPDNHGLVLTTSWKLNGSDVNNARVSIQGDELTISPVLPTDIYDVFTCETQETGPGVGPLNSQESENFKPTPCSTNLTAVYVADGTIKVTWDPPITTKRNTVFRLVVGVYDSDVRLERGFLSVNERVYRYMYTRPNTTYTLKMHKMISNFTDIDETIITTPPAMYHQRGTRVTLSLPRPTNGSSLIVFNGQTLLSYFDDEIVGGNTTAENDLTVNLTSTYTELTINSLEPRHAGYYYTMKQNGSIIPGGQMLVVTDKPTRPTITRSNCFSLPTTSLTLTCSSRSRSKPDNHGLDFMTSWKVNGSDVNLTRVSIDGAHLTVDPVLPTDIYDVFKCVTHENGSYGLSPINSQESGYFKMTPGCVPERPVDFRASKASFNYISVMWTSGYNGGFSQEFHIEIISDGSSWLPVRWNISDAGQGSLMEYTISDLTPATDFVIRLKVSNKHGSVMSSEITARTLSTYLRAVYVADGSIKVTWEQPDSTFERVFGVYLSVYESNQLVSLSANVRVYRYIHSYTRPDTTYKFELLTLSAPAMYQQRGTRVTLSLPRPTNGSSLIVFNGQTLYSYFDDEIVGGNTTAENDLTVNLTSTYTQLTINSLEARHAGYYYTIEQTGSIIRGGQMLVVTDTPTRPTITRSNCFSLPTTSLTLTCSSRSQSKPDNHGMNFMTSWKVNGSDVNPTRVSINGAHLTVDPVLPTDIYDVFTCVTHEKGPFVLAPINSQESGYFKMTPGCVPERPVDFRASKARFNYISVLWTSGYNGGISQEFHIESMSDGSSWLPARWNISDAGQGSLMEYTISDLTPATDYAIRLKVSNKHGSGMSSEISARTLTFPLTPDTLLNMAIGVVTAGVVLLICVIAIVVFAIKLIRRYQEQIADKRSQNIHSNTTSLELQNRAVIRGRPESRIREPEGAYATVDEDILSDLALPSQCGVTQNDDSINHSYLTVIGDDAYMDMKPPVGGASRNEETDQYIDLKHNGGDASKNGDKPQYKNMEQTGSRTSQNDKQDHYIGLKQTRGHGHVYDTTRAVEINELKGRASDDNKKEDVLIKMTRSKTL